MKSVIALIATALHLAPHPFGVTPVGALALYAGAHAPRSAAWALPLLPIVAASLITGYFDVTITLFVLAGFALSAVVAGLLFRKGVTPRSYLLAVICAAFTFYLVSNFSMWLAGFYPPTVEGLVSCYINGIPFFLRALLADAVFGLAFFCFASVWFPAAGQRYSNLRVVTLLPSATEIVCAIGGREMLVGVSHSCRLPPGSGDLPRLTSTRIPIDADSVVIDASVRQHLETSEALYDLDVSGLDAVNPDIVVSQALCDVCATSTGDVMDAVCGLGSSPDVVDLNPNTLSDVFNDICRVGEALGLATEARHLVANLKNRRNRVSDLTAGISLAQRPSVAFLEWLLPPFNGGHWNPELVERAGGIDLLGASGLPSSTLQWHDIARAEPEVVFVSCCGLGIDRACEDIAALADNAYWTALPAVQNQRIYVVDGDRFFSSPGPRLIDALEIMAFALHPGIHAQPADGAATQVDRFGHPVGHA